MSTTSVPLGRHARADKERRRVTTRGKRVSRRRGRQAPRAPRPYRKTATLGGLAVFFNGVLYLLGTIAWTTAAVTAVAGTAAVGYLEYRAQLAQVRRNGRPIGVEDKPAEPPPAAEDESDLEPVVEPEPVDLDDLDGEQPRRRSRPEPKKRPERRTSAAEHASRCTAKSRSTCRCPDGPNRKSKGKTSGNRGKGQSR